MTYFTDTSVARPRTARPSISQMIALWKQRRALRNMDARMLDDLGLTRQEALEEANRPVWNVPAHWLR